MNLFKTGPKFEFKDITIKKVNSIYNFGDYFSTEINLLL